MARRWSRGILVTALVAGLTPVSTPAAQAAWSDARTISQEDTSGSGPDDTATDRQGNTVVVWTTTDNSCARPGGCGRVQLRTVSRAGTLGPIVTVSPPEHATLYWPQVATDDDGDSVVSWERFDAAQNIDRAYARLVSRTGVLGQLVTLGPDREHGKAPKVAIGPTGDAIVAWRGEAPGRGVVARARWIFHSGKVGALFDFTDSTEELDVAVDRTGVATIVYGGFTHNKLEARRISPDGTLSAPRDLSLGSHEYRYYVPRIGLDRDGDARVVFKLTGQGDYGRLYGRSLSRTGKVGPAVLFTREGDPLYHYRAFAVAPDGHAIVVWSTGPYQPRLPHKVNKHTTLHGRRWASDNSLGATVDLGSGAMSHLALDAAGNGVLANDFVLGPKTDDTGTQVRTVSSAGVFGAPVELSRHGGDPLVGVAPTGETAVFWQDINPPYGLQLVTGE